MTWQTRCVSVPRKEPQLAMELRTVSATNSRTPACVKTVTITMAERAQLLRVSLFSIRGFSPPTRNLVIDMAYTCI